MTHQAFPSRPAPASTLLKYQRLFVAALVLRQVSSSSANASPGYLTISMLELGFLPLRCGRDQSKSQPKQLGRIECGPKKGDGSDGLQNWVANIFLIYFFEWLHGPRDVDGDGRSTLMDAYRHAGVYANTHLRDTKRNLHIEVEQLRTQLVHLSKQPSTPITQLQIQATHQQLDQALESLYLHQEPWILNAYLATSIEF
ncbi:hypothetical protein ACN28S_58260 [Cystobacter fuscus]